MERFNYMDHRRGRRRTDPWRPPLALLLAALAWMAACDDGGPTTAGPGTGTGQDIEHTLRVPTDHATIQAAIDAAADGDTVLVAAGVFTGAGNTNLVLAGKDLTLRGAGGDGGSPTVIDCEGHGRALELLDGVTRRTVIEGIDFRNGGDVELGGAIHIDPARPTLRDCTFEGNQAEGGGALHVAAMGSATLERCRFERNLARHGAAIGLLGDSLLATGCTFTGNDPGTLPAAAVVDENGAADMRLVDCVFTGNAGTAVTARSANVALVRCELRAGAGPAVRILGGAPCLAGCTFASNLGDGVILGVMPDGATPERVPASAERVGRARARGRLTDCLFSANAGAGLRAAAASVDSIVRCVFDSNDGTGLVWNAGTPVAVAHCEFAGNAASGIAVGGGAAADVTDCKVSDNQATAGDAHDGHGGGLIVLSGGTARIERCAVTGNVAASRGGGVCCEAGSTLELTASVVAANRSAAGGGLFLDAAQATVIGCTLHGNRSTDGAGGGIWLGSTTGAGATLELRGSIIAASEGFAVDCRDDAPAGSITVTCTTLYANSGGGWVRCLTDWRDREGNRSLDPMFCAAATGDFHLRAGSPCLPESSGFCGLVGALPAGCE
ncbi:MAG: right-handed parallel beta-helix repeat-containing protein [Candidatus Eiseniibacteriota bacterium]|jgi:hypothetical protein